MYWSDERRELRILTLLIRPEYSFFYLLRPKATILIHNDCSLSLFTHHTLVCTQTQTINSKSLDKMGANMEVAKYTEKLVPSTRFVAVDGVAPQVAEYGTFVAPSASVIGDVTIGRNSRYER